MNANKNYTLDEVKHLGAEIVMHMRACGSVSWDVWYAYAATPIAQRYFAVCSANPKCVPLF